MFVSEWGYGRLLQKLGEAHNLKLEPVWEVGPGDYDENTVKSMVNPPPYWRGAKKRKGDDRLSPFQP